MAYHLVGDPRYADKLKDFLQNFMKQVQTISLDDAQCQLNFAWGIPELVASADLIQDYGNDQTSTWPISTSYTSMEIGSGNCKSLFQNWLAKHPYYIISLSAERSQSNWGAAVTTTLAYIADCLSVMHKRNTHEVIEENPTYDR